MFECIKCACEKSPEEMSADGNKCKACRAAYMRDYNLRTGRTRLSKEELANERNLESKEYGEWTVLRRVQGMRSGSVRYTCKCSCGTLRDVLAEHLRKGTSTSCGCMLRKGRRHKLWRGYGDISGNYWDFIKRGAAGGKGRRTAVPFEISIEYAWNLFLAHGQKCVLSNLPLVINYSRKTGMPHTASLDRIDPAKGYVEGNVQWLHKDVNMMKRVYDQNYFIEMCVLVANNQRVSC